MKALMTCECANCDWKGPIEEAKEPRDLWARVDAGCEVPAGECPQCGALAYLPKAELEIVPRGARGLVVVEIAGGCESRTLTHRADCIIVDWDNILADTGEIARLTADELAKMLTAPTLEREGFRDHANTLLAKLRRIADEKSAGISGVEKGQDNPIAILADSERSARWRIVSLHPDWVLYPGKNDPKYYATREEAEHALERLLANPWNERARGFFGVSCEP